MTVDHRSPELHSLDAWVLGRQTEMAREESTQKDIQMDKPTYELRPLLAELRDGYREMRTLRTSLRTAKREMMRTARAERKTLKRDLAGYTTPGDRADLEAILARYSDEETANIRKLLPARSCTSGTRLTGASGRRLSGLACGNNPALSARDAHCPAQPL